MAIFLGLSGIFLIYLAICTGYLLLFAIAGKMSKANISPPEKQTLAYKIVVLIPAYKEDAVITEVAKQSLLQSYPKNLYDVVVISDSLQQETISALEALPVKVIKVQFENSTKAKALNAALYQLPAYDIAIVLDADNVMDVSFIEKIAHDFSRGNTIVQGHRMAKNLNTSIAVLDAISEEINNHIFRKGHCAMGLSSALIGSAMAFDYTYFKEKMALISAVSGFDKALELAILKEGRYIHYAEDAIVFDEKVQRVTDFRNQRTRWIAAQIKYLCMHFFSGIQYLFKGNIDYFDKVVQLMLPPRIILLGLLCGITLVSALMQHTILTASSAISLVLLLLTLYVSAPRQLIKKISWKDMFNIPVLFFHFMLSLIYARKARYTFIHTPHGEVKQK